MANCFPPPLKIKLKKPPINATTYFYSTAVGATM